MTEILHYLFFGPPMVEHPFCFITKKLLCPWVINQKAGSAHYIKMVVKSRLPN